MRKIIFNHEEWLTPDTYWSNYAQLPETSGIYMFCQVNINGKERTFKPLYVGMSQNIAKRCRGHEIKRLLPDDEFIRTYYREANENLRAIEREYIRAFNPPFNIIGRPRGI